MRLGWCAPIDQAGLIKSAGYDFLEAPLAAFDLDSAAGLAAAKRAVQNPLLPLTVFSRFYPNNMRVVGPDVDASRVKSYLARAAELLSHAGARTAVLGSAWARNVPPGFSRATAERQNLESYDWVADAFADSGIVIAIEGQNRKEANLILTLADAVEAARAVNRPETIRVVADFYHMEEEKEPLSHLQEYAGWIAHVQLADTGRRNPGTGTYDYDTFFRNLKDGGYDSTVSVECPMEIPPPGMTHSLNFLRPYCA